MLKIIDKYIIRKFLSTFFFMMGVIMLLAMVFDLSERLSEFITNKAPVSSIVLDYYVNFLIYYGNTFSPMIIFIAVIWFTAKMAQETEIIPLLNSGRPFVRILRPYMIAATILMLISFGLNHIVLPRANDARLRFEEQFYRDQLYVENYNAEFPNRQFVHFSNYTQSTNTVSDFVVEQFNEKGEQIAFLKARSALVKPGSNKWQLNDYYYRRVGKQTEVKSVTGETEYTFEKDVLRVGKSLDTIFPFYIDEMAQRDNVVEAMIYTDLKRFIARERQKGNPNVPAYEIELYQRTSFPFATYVLTLIGVAVSSRKKRGGIGVNIAIGLGFVFVYIFAMKVTTVAAIKVGFPAIVAVWIPNVLFGLVAYLLYRLAPK